MSEDRLRLGAIELQLPGGGALLVRAVDIDHVTVSRVRDPARVEALRREYQNNRLPYDDYDDRPNPGLQRRINEVPLVDKCTVVLRSTSKHDVLNSKEELLDVIRNS